MSSLKSCITTIGEAFQQRVQSPSFFISLDPSLITVVQVSTNGRRGEVSQRGIRRDVQRVVFVVRECHQRLRELNKGWPSWLQRRHWEEGGHGSDVEGLLVLFSGVNIVQKRRLEPPSLLGLY